VARGSSGPPRRPTLVDVAARAGVSRAMASIVLRGAPGASPQTRDRVLAAAADLGYRPDARARLLASRQSRQLGVVFLMAGRFHLELLDALYVAAERAGYELILSALTPSRDERRAVETLLDFRCEAVVQLGPGSGPPVLAGRLPVVVVGWAVDHPEVDVVRTSDDGARQAVDHLVALGHRRIVHVDGGAGVIADSRRSAYAAAMSAHGLQRHARTVAGGVLQEDGVAAARRLLEGRALPTAVVAFNDDVAAGLLETLVRAGVAVPGDVSVVGWDDTPLARLPHLDLTTVRQDVDAIAALSVERSVARLTGRPVADREVVLSPQLVVRTSTAPPRRPRTADGERRLR
jgi:DNA-binding LacI/PurR family transcriptional regulator